MKTINPSTNRRVIKAHKPRNPILVAPKAAQCAKGGPHQKSRGALRRAEKMALLKDLAGDD